MHRPGEYTEAVPERSGSVEPDLGSLYLVESRRTMFCVLDSVEFTNTMASAAPSIQKKGLKSCDGLWYAISGKIRAIVDWPLRAKCDKMRFLGQNDENAKSLHVN